MSSFVSTRRELQRIATHVMARRRFQVCGRFGLRATPGGFGTPAFGEPDRLEVVRVAGTAFVHEVGSEVMVHPLAGSTLESLAAHVGADLSVELSVGHDTPDVGDVRAPVIVEEVAAARVAALFDLGWRALDAVLERVDGAATLQLWPEHFDAGTSVAVGDAEADRANLGASPGDGFHEGPYLYVGPWGSARPGDPSYWNAPFGAVLAAAEVNATADPLATAVAFYERGITSLRAGAGA